MSDKYILDGKTPKSASLMEWAKWFETAERRVAHDQVGDVSVSTVFLGIDHNWGEGEPLIFETMIFGGSHDKYQTRCSTWDQAEKMHADALALVRQSTPMVDNGAPMISLAQAEFETAARECQKRAAEASAMAAKYQALATAMSTLYRDAIARSVELGE